MVKAFDITEKNCKKKKIGHKRIARYSALFCETKYQANPVAAMEPPNPPRTKTRLIKMRETNSILPRLLRRPLRNMRQRRSAIAVSWVETSGRIISDGLNSRTCERGARRA